MSDFFIGELRLMSFNFPPKGWAFANGQTLAINQNQALFALFGTTYGGNGVTTFQLPNMQSRVPIHFGTSPIDGNTYVQGQVGGAEAVTLIQTQMPAHTHALNGTSQAGDTARPIGHTIAAAPNTPAGPAWVASSNTHLTPLIPQSISSIGGNQPHTNIQPYLTISFCVALQGIFPSRN
ncbi:MAG TPA: tail fiber protein [Caulobacteraceae bacterium]|nr:tail fiber protein [Caulobacteraceae bacterium]